jgi:hypothetical protein
MPGFGTIITAVVMAASLTVLAALYRRFRRQAVEPLHAGLAAAAFVLGLIAIPGLIHTVAVVSTAVNNHKPYDLRLVFLLTLGLIFIYTGSVNMLLSGRIKRSEREALVMSASTTALLVGFLAVLYPAKSETLLIVVNGAYLGLLLVGLHRPGRPPSRAAA